MISLAGRDILHSWGKFVFTGIGLGLLIGVTLTMAGVYRGMVDDGKALLDNSGADLWVVQRDTLGPSITRSKEEPEDQAQHGKQHHRDDPNQLLLVRSRALENIDNCPDISDQYQEA